MEGRVLQLTTRLLWQGRKVPKDALHVRELAQHSAEHRLASRARVRVARSEPRVGEHADASPARRKERHGLLRREKRAGGGLQHLAARHWLLHGLGQQPRRAHQTNVAAGQHVHQPAVKLAEHAHDLRFHPAVRGRHVQRRDVRSRDVRNRHVG